MNDNFKRGLSSPAAMKRWLRWDALAADRAAAMERIGVDLPIPNLSWSQLFQPWNFWRRLPQWPLTRRFDVRPAYVIFDYRPMDRATADAKAFLMRNGVNIPEVDPWGSGTLDSLDGTDAFLKSSGLRQLWQKKR